MRRKRYDLSKAMLATEWTASVLGLTLFGLWLDRRMGTAPWALVVCAVIGFVGGTYNFIRSAQKTAREAERRAAEEARERDRDRAGE